MSQYAMQKCRSQSPRQRGRLKGINHAQTHTTKMTPDDSTCTRDPSRASQPGPLPPSHSQHGILHKHPRERAWWFSSQQTAPSTSHSEHLLISQNQRQVFEKANVLWSLPQAVGSVTLVSMDIRPFLDIRLQPAPGE